MSTSALPTVSFREILVPFDFSDTSDRALEYAQAISRQHSSRLLLVHVVEGHVPVTPGTEWVEESAVRMAEQVEATGMSLREQGFQAESLNRFGTLINQIKELTQAREVDLIVAGTHAGEGLDRAIFGSNAEKLARSIDCPVLLIGPMCSKAGERWLPSRILVATRLYPQRAAIAIYAARLARLTHAEWKLMHVAHPGQAFEREVWQNYIQEVATLAPDVSFGDHQKKILASEQHASLEILQFARDWHADLIVMGASHDSIGVTHFRRGALGEVLAEAVCPILAVRH